ncbi:hypothetical protein EPUS_03260 [Endocarpon pusillum Z07020]|uniref:Transmembrane protein n=1 Tax=Endocarpon pusillum (strain Z07020 / HMAS-L-300199) TaxID=1263415 RepID=U1GSA3_ENDPU|nr:uncharacterized protein EPUS_03260 [Endocarpon pusillum Z07020]ERF74876.1 hypothetical protein EPUS_03260 [Endocarpon pusillum Z07020]
MNNGAKTTGYEQPAVATNRNSRQNKAVDCEANEPPAEPQASLESLLKAHDYEQPTAATNMNLHKDKAVDGDTKQPPAEPQRWPEILREALNFATKLSVGLIRMLRTFVVTLAPFLSTLLVLFFLVNILRAAFESSCKIPFVPYISYPYCQSFDDRTQRVDSLENLQSQLNVVREVAGIVDHSKVPSRDKIVDHLTDFWQLTDNTIDGLGDFLQGIDRMVDSTITRNEITLRNLRNIASKRAEPASIVLQVIAVLFHTPLTAENAIRRQYLEHLDRLMAETDRLLLDSHLQDNNLKRLANIQWDIHNIIVGDNDHVTEQEQEVQGNFWAQFGGYKKLLDDYKQQAAVLQQLDVQRK